MNALRRWLGLTTLAVAGGLHAAPVLVTSVAALGANDIVNWSQLGAGGTTISQNFAAVSANSVHVTGSFAGSGACIALVGDSQCGWNPGPGFGAGDSFVWAENSDGVGSGPLSLSFAAMLGAGLYVQANQNSGSGPYTMAISAFNGANQLANFTETSNSVGDGLFIGVLDTTPDITKITLSLFACNCDLQDFAANSLRLREVPVVSEPSTLCLLMLGSMSLLFVRHRKTVVVGSKAGEAA